MRELVRGRVLVVAAALSAMAIAQPARAQVHADPALCVRTAEEGQRARAAGKMRDARIFFQTCVSEACPSLVRQDCGAWASELSAAMPTIVIDARDADGRDIADVTVRFDGELIASKADGQAIAVDPGPHTLKFERVGFAPVTQKVIIKEGVKARPFVVTLSSPLPQSAAVEPEAEVEPETADSSRRKTRKIIGGVSVVAGTVLAAVTVVEVIRYFGLRSDSEDRAAKVVVDPSGRPCKETDFECAQIDKDLKSATLLALVFGTLSVTSLGFGAYMLFSRPSKDTPAKPTTKIVPNVSVGSAGVLIEGSF